MYIAAVGIYEVNAGVFKVVTNQKSGRNYAKKMIGVHNNKPVWEFAKGAVTKLRPETKLSEKRAAEFGALYGTCLICSRQLDNEESIARGIGPVCATNYL